MTGLLTQERARRGAQLVGWTRIAFGAAFTVAPSSTARPWIGVAANSVGGKLMTRSMGARDALLGVGLLRALQNEDDTSAANWLAYGVAAGVVDSLATVAAYRSLSRTGRAFLAFITSAMVGDALLSRAVAAQRPTRRE